MSYNKETGIYEGYIYCITNTINNKKYIGQTAQNIARRFQSHKDRSKNPKQYIHNAMSVYGVENFHIEEIIKVTDKSSEGLAIKLDEHEKFYIKLFNTVNPRGYNNTIGGRINDGFKKKHRRVFQYSLTGDLISVYDSLKDASDLTGFDKGGISRCCLGDIKSSSGYVWRYEDVSLEINSYANNFTDDGGGVTLRGSHVVKKVYKYDINGNLLSVYDSALDIEEESNGCFKRPAIQACCTGRCYTYKGFVWRYHGDDFYKYIPKDKNIAPKTPSKKNTKNDDSISMRTIPIDKYTTNLEYVCTYNNVYEIPNISKKQAINIISCCQGKTITSYGNIWRFHDNDVNKYKTSRSRYKSVAMIDDGGLVVKVFNNAQLAAEYVDGDRSCIVKCCKGITNRHKHKGYVWKYYNDLKNA